ncbi:non-canonical purine NTP pyrophosphatase [Lacticaseibacillus daqingensis]|uniref:non-canonical purine NTP pyrophosphatase n=1 Tax=Lacticaseibacillus daqingensis TaxID=2486014 RepID=UPI000F7B15FE|nr:non-canonical purine NTP pyrophosphatase [Lacticaseibacillus daqingensis]
MTDFIFASHNAGKLAEVQALLTRWGHTAHAFDGALPPEGTVSLAANALAKAQAVHAALPRAWVLADDSGLFAPALPGQLGVQTARELPRTGTNQALLALLAGHDRHVILTSAMVLITPAGTTTTATGQLPALVADAPRGIHSTGFDRVLVPLGATQTLAELPAAERLPQLPRTRALTQLLGGLTHADH